MRGQVELLIAGGVLVAIVASLLLSSHPAVAKTTTTTETIIQTTTTLPVTTQYKEEHGNLELTDSIVRTDNSFNEQNSIQNKGNTNANASVFDVYPSDFLNANGSTRITAPLNASEAVTNSSLLSSDPLVQSSHYSIPAGRNVTKESSFDSNVSATPSELIVNPPLNDSQQQQLLPLITKVADLNLTQDQTKALQKKVNEVLADRSKPFDQKLNDTQAIVRQAEEINVLKNSGAFNNLPEVKSNGLSNFVQKRIDAITPKQNKATGTNLFPQLPDEIVLHISEDKLTDSATASFTVKHDLDQPLWAINGQIASYVNANFDKSMKEYVISVAADFTSLDMDELGQIPFDEAEGELVVFFPSLPEQSKSIHLKVVVNHIPVSKEDRLAIEQPVAEEQFNSIIVPGEPPKAPPITPTSATASSLSKCLNKAKQITDYAGSFVGILPYVWGGTSLTRGADCSGFLQSIYKKFGLSLPKVSYEQYVEGKKVNRNDLLPGDLVFFTNPDKSRTRGRPYGITHVAMYIGQGQYGKGTLVNEPKSKRKAEYRDLYSTYDAKYYVGAARYIPECKLE